MGALGRVELPTNGLGNRCSIHLSYRATRRNRLDHFSLSHLGVAIYCPIAGRRFPALPLPPLLGPRAQHVDRFEANSAAHAIVRWAVSIKATSQSTANTANDA
jgi:hypothetical protein